MNRSRFARFFIEDPVSKFRNCIFVKIAGWSGRAPKAIFNLAWRARVLAYGAFLRDEYPPFGEGNSPVTLELPEEPGIRDNVSILFRPFLLLPHLLWLLALFFAWIFVGVFSWIWLAFTATLPVPVWRFSRDVMAYSLRVETYALLLHDEFQAFSLARIPEGRLKPN